MGSILIPGCSTANSLVDGFDAVIRYLGGYVRSYITPLKIDLPCGMPLI
jgi:hypothetical protein